MSQALDPTTVYRVEYDYSSEHVYSDMARRLGIMLDWKVRGRGETFFPCPKTFAPKLPQDGVPRTAYMGVVSLAYNGCRVHLAPKQPWHGYAG